VPTVLDRWQEILLCRGIAGELVGDHHPRRSPLPLQELARQPLGGFRITPALNQNVEHDAVLIDGAPQPVRRPGDLDDDLIEVPLVAGPRQAPLRRLSGKRKYSQTAWLMISGGSGDRRIGSERASSSGPDTRCRLPWQQYRFS
jgi:hypothetical protein